MVSIVIASGTSMSTSIRAGSTHLKPGHEYAICFLVMFSTMACAASAEVSIYSQIHTLRPLHPFPILQRMPCARLDAFSDAYVARETWHWMVCSLVLPPP